MNVVTFQFNISRMSAIDIGQHPRMAFGMLPPSSYAKEKERPKAISTDIENAATELEALVRMDGRSLAIWGDHLSMFRDIEVHR